MKVVYKKDLGRLVSIDLSGGENIVRDNAELLTEGQATALLTDHADRQIMDEDDWFSY